MEKIWGENMSEKNKEIAKKKTDAKKNTKSVKKTDKKKKVATTKKEVKPTKKVVKMADKKKNTKRKTDTKKATTKKKSIFRKKREAKLIIPQLEPSKEVDFDKYEDYIGIKTPDWQEKKVQLLQEHELRLQGKEISEEIEDSKRDSNLALILLVAIAIIILSFTFVTNLYRKELQRQKKETQALNELQDTTNDDEEIEEEIKTQTMTCTTTPTQIENYQSSVLSISTFENDNLVTYEYIVTKKYADQGSYDSAKLASQNQNDIIFDNNQLTIKTYFGNGHIESVPQETTYLGKTVQEVKAQEEAAGAICTLSE